MNQRMRKRATKLLGLVAILTALAATTAWAAGDRRHAVDFFPGHRHDANDATVGAPEHSGGTDKYGCHNGSVPYHCH